MRKEVDAAKCIHYDRNTMVSHKRKILPLCRSRRDLSHLLEIGHELNHQPLRRFQEQAIHLHRRPAIHFKR